MKNQFKQYQQNEESNELLTLKQKTNQNIIKRSISYKQIFLAVITLTVSAIILVSVLILQGATECDHVDLEEVIKKMRHRPYNKILQPHQQYRQYHRATPAAYFGYRLMMFPENALYQAAELYLYDQKYGIGRIKKQQQVKLCIISTGYNIKSKRKRVQTYFDSILRQNYTNYHLVYIDDASPDGTTEYAKQYVQKKYPNLAQRVTFILNQKKTQALHNKLNGIKNYCKADQVVVDIDSDDALIGRQVFNLIHQGYYENKETWLLYTSHIFYHSEFKEPLQGSSQTLPTAMLQSNKQRLIGNFTIMHLRTFKRQIFMKIPDTYWKNQSGNHYQWISDGWIYSALAQLSGPQRIKFIPEVTYFYFRQSQQINRKQKKEGTLLVRYATPFQQLSSQLSEVKTVQNYQIKDEELAKVRKKYENAYKNIQKQVFVQNEEYEQIINQIRKIPNISQQKLPKSAGLTPNSQLAYRMMSSPYNKEYNNAIKYMYNKKYQLYTVQKQLPICIFSMNRISIQNDFRFINFVDSINRQNYQNIKIVYVDTSLNIDASTSYLQYIINQSPRLADKFKIVSSPAQNALKFKYQIMEKQCSQDSIIVELSSLNQLVGRQALRLVNTMYQKRVEKKIIFFSSYYLIKNGYPVQSKNQIKFREGRFDRKLSLASIQGLMTYRYQLISKFPVSFWEEGEKYLQQNKKYWMLFGLLQSVGVNNIQICEEVILYRFKQGQSRTTLKSEKQFDQIKNKPPFNNQHLDDIG